VQPSEQDIRQGERNLADPIVGLLITLAIPIVLKACPGLNLGSAHEIAHGVQDRLRHHLPKLTEATVHAGPASGRH